MGFSVDVLNVSSESVAPRTGKRK